MLLLAGISAQAQNTIHFTTWETSGVNYGLSVSEENMACFDDSTMENVSDTVEYSWENNVLTIGGTSYAIQSPSQQETYNTSFGANQYYLFKLNATKDGIGGGAQPAQPTAIPKG